MAKCSELAGLGMPAGLLLPFLDLVKGSILTGL